MLCVRDLAASIDFYDRLGFLVHDRQDHIALLALGECRLYLFLESPPTEDKPNVRFVPQASETVGNTILVLAVDDCRAAYRQLSARGIEFITPPKQPRWGGWRCFAHDPDGYVVEIEQSARVRRQSGGFSSE